MIFLLKILNAIQSFVQLVLNKLWGRVSTSDSKRIPLSNTAIRIVGIAFLSTFFIFIITKSVFFDDSKIDQKSKLEKELQKDDGVSIDIVNKVDFDEEHLDEPENFMPTPQTNQDDGVASVDECRSLVGNVKMGSGLPPEQRSKFEKCMSGNVLNLTPQELAAIRTAATPGLTDTQRAEAIESLSGKKPKDKDVVNSLVANNPENLAVASNNLRRNGVELTEEQLAAMIKKNVDAGKKDAIEAVVAASAGKQLTKAQMEAIAEKAASGAVSAAVDGKIASAEKNLTAARDEIRKKNEELQNIKKEIQENAKEASKGSVELTNGREPSAEQMAAIVKLAELKKRKNVLAAEISAAVADLKKQQEELQKALAEINTVTEEVVSGDWSDEIPGDKETVIAGVKKGKKKPGGKPGDKAKDKAKDKDNPEGGTTDAAVAKLPDPKKEFEDDLLGKGGSLSGLKLNTELWGTEVMDAKRLIAETEKGADGLHLSSKSKFAAYLIHDLYIPSNQQGQQIRVKLLMDIYDSETNRIAIPKGTVLVASAGTFSDETGVMDLTFIKASVGKHKYSFSMKAGSGDGSMGLKGDIYDTRARKLLAAGITSFVAGATQWFASSVIASYASQTKMGPALTGASLQGISDVANKFASMQIADLNNTPSIFFLPKGAPVILFPDDQ